MRRPYIHPALAMVLALASGAFAQEPSGQATEEMGPMGPPEEMTHLASLVGTWDADTKMRMDTAAEWMTSKGLAEFSYIAGGACLQMKYTSEWMGMPFSGFSHTTFNRATGEWMETWVDNMGGYMSVYKGGMQGAKKVLTGQDYMMGQVWQTRLTTTNMTPTSFDWQLEHSKDNGKTWGVYMTARYTKRGS